ncbi:carbonic anhydrase family protein [Pendulispora rubella]|uniref:Carbonic anhydrase n=2 Tax=Pendulispora rubella TaxID=2741070 RepID=A0ABZ2KPE3_9BACT
MKYIAGALAALGAMICACSSDAETHDDHADAATCVTVRGGPLWNYSAGDPLGPSHWGEIASAQDASVYPDCANESQQQSPIAMARSGAGVVARPFQLGSELAWSTAATVQNLRNDGHTWIAGFDPAQNQLRVDGTDYGLAQFHVHAPSEHTLDGKEYPLEAHFVHLDASGTQPFAAVIAVMFEESENDNPELAKIWPKFDRCAQEAPSSVTGVTLDLPRLLPEGRTYMTYDGSLTTPPCSFTVRFFVLLEPLKASKAQIRQLQDAVGRNNRPIQPILAGTQVSIHRP